MRAKIMLTKILPLFGILFLASCSYTTQTTSGKDFLANDPLPPKGTPVSDIDVEVREAAAVEPLLRFPARIGIARLQYGRLSAIPADEADAWAAAAAHLGNDFGEFVPVSPLIAAMFEPDSPFQYGKKNSARRTLDIVRLAAARQHLDAVVIYEVDATSDVKGSPLSIAEWTVIGALMLPTENVKAEGVAQAILLDVRNGYPYGTVRASSDDKSVTTRFTTHDTSDQLEKEVRAAAVVKLADETEAMMRTLKPQLAALDAKPKHR